MPLEFKLKDTFSVFGRRTQTEKRILTRNVSFTILFLSKIFKQGYYIKPRLL